MAECKRSMNRKRMQTWRSGDSGIPRLVGFSSRPGEAETVAYLALLASPAHAKKVNEVVNPLPTESEAFHAYRLRVDRLPRGTGGSGIRRSMTSRPSLWPFGAHVVTSG